MSEGSEHLVLDIRHWQMQFPLGDARGEGGWVDDPIGLARVEQARQLASAVGELGPSVPADVFTWAWNRDSRRPWLTKLGGLPWREADRPWPKGPDKEPLRFLGQICFADSRDILPFEVPGEVALVFGRWDGGYAGVDGGAALEWSSLRLAKPTTHGNSPELSRLPFEYQGIRHRTVQFRRSEATERAFKGVGYKGGGWGVAAAQATCVSTFADLPQGWPFDEGDGCTLVAVLSSFLFQGEWPLCDVPRSVSTVDAQGQQASAERVSALSLGIGDAGTIWLFRDRRGRFLLDEASH